MATQPHLRLGEILLKAGLVTPHQLQEGIRLQKGSKKRLGEALVALHYLSESQLAELLAGQMGLPFVQFEKGELTQSPDPHIKAILSEKLIRSLPALPLIIEGTNLKVAVVDPFDLLLFDNLKKLTNYRIEPVVTTHTDIMKAIDVVYGKSTVLKKALKEAVEGSYGERIEEEEDSSILLGRDVTEILPSEEQLQSPEALMAQAGEAQVVRLVDLFLLDAVNSRASDIHIEPYAEQISIRFRIDGLLRVVDPPSMHLMPAIISRIKILSRMDIAEKRLPQDGGFTIRSGERVIDLRVSTIPVIYGEKVVIRILDKSNLVFDFKALGMESKELSDVEEVIKSPYGLIFLTGPTGSGKSTTLYAMLGRIKSSAKNIVTIEDPVEYKIEGINQVQAKPLIGLTFAAGLRAFLRQDPDILMVGEVRDIETAEICVRAALTGHLVLSTLHTNDAASAITRLIDLGIEPFPLSPSLLMMIAQRLIRKLCTECREPHKPPSALVEKFELPQGSYYQAKGCKVCGQTGYRGRVAVYEVLRINNALQELIAKSAPLRELKKAAQENGMRTLLETGLVKAAQGITSIEEVLSIAAGEL